LKSFLAIAQNKNSTPTQLNSVKNRSFDPDPTSPFDGVLWRFDTEGGKIPSEHKMFPYPQLPYCRLMEWIPVFFNLYDKIHCETQYSNTQETWNFQVNFYT
jgi:hypothetical protein